MAKRSRTTSQSHTSYHLALAPWGFHSGPGWLLRSAAVLRPYKRRSVELKLRLRLPAALHFLLGNAQFIGDNGNIIRCRIGIVDALGYFAYI